MAATAERECEVILTLNERDYHQLGDDVKTLRAATGAPSNTAAILAAVRSEATRVAERSS
jgi:hypothetical protein